MENCFLVRHPAHHQNGTGGGGSIGNISPINQIVVRRTAAIGDSLAATIVATKLQERGFSVVWQTHPAIHCVVRRHPHIALYSEPNGFTPDVNLDGAYERDALRRRRHFSDMFLGKANEQLSRMGINLGPALNVRPRIRVSSIEKEVARKALQQYPRPWTLVCPRSDTYNVRQVPDGVWSEAARHIKGTVFWIGRHPGPPNIVDLKCRHFDNVILWLSVADLLCSVDTGPLHVGAALGIPIVAIGQSSSPELHLSDQCDFVTITPGLNCLNCQENLCPVQQHIPPCQNMDPNLIAWQCNRRLDSQNSGEVSAIISIYKPEVGTLNRCLEHVLPQVSEVIVCSDTYGILPQGAMQHQKIRYVQKPLSNIGYGRKQNFAARHSNGEFLLLLNDDVFLAPDAVKKMMECMKPGVGMVSNLLRYPEGTIYHAGKRRSPGERGWGHIDHRMMDCTIKEPTEMENVCGACVIVRRKAFYDIDGFDEDFFIYAEDDSMCLALRKFGWRIMFTPHSTGIHMEHQSTKKTGNIMDFVNASNKIFHRKWGPYLEHNLNRVPGTFDY